MMASTIFGKIKNFTETPYWKYLRIIGLVLGLTIFARQIYAGWSELSTLIISKNLWKNFVLSTLWSLFVLFFQYTIWYLILKLINSKIAFIPAFWGYIISFIPRYIPGTIWGYLSRMEWLKSDYKIDRKISVFTMLLEQVFTVSSVLVFFIIYIGKKTLIWVVLALLLSATVTIAFVSILLKHFKFHLPVNKRFPARFWFNVLLILTCYILMWILYGIGIFILIGAPKTGLVFTAVFREIINLSIAFSLAWFSGFAIFFIPSGVGVRESVLAKFLKKSCLIIEMPVTAISLVYRLVVSVAELIYVIIGLIAINLRNRLPLRSADND